MPTHSKHWRRKLEIWGRSGILAYHGVSEIGFLPQVHLSTTALCQQLAYVTDRMQVIPLTDLLQRWRRGRSTQNYVAITFDDAYLSVLTLALPLLERRGLPFTIFVPSGFPGGFPYFWWDRVEAALAGAPAALRPALEAVVGAGHQHDLRARISSKDGNVWASHLEEALTAIEDKVGMPPDRVMNWDELTRISKSGLVDFGVHTQTHCCLPCLRPAHQVEEIRDCYTALRERLPRVRPLVAYPYGMYTQTTMDAAREAGMVGGLTMQGHALMGWCDHYAVPRIGLAGVNKLRTLRLRTHRSTVPLVIWRNRGVHPRPPGCVDDVD